MIVYKRREPPIVLIKILNAPESCVCVHDFILCFDFLWFVMNMIKVRSDQLYVGEIGFVVGLRDYVNF